MISPHITDMRTLIMALNNELNKLGEAQRAPILAQADIDMNGYRVRNLGTAKLRTDATTKGEGIALGMFVNENGQHVAHSTLIAPNGVRSKHMAREADDLVPLHQVRTLISKHTGGSNGGPGPGGPFMDLTTDQVVTSGNKDFDSISFHATTFTLGDADVILNGTLAGATVWVLSPTTNAIVPGPIIRGIAPPFVGSAPVGMFRILLWLGQNSALRLAHRSTVVGVQPGAQIHTMSLTTSDTLAAPQLIGTVGPGAFILYYNYTNLEWVVVASRA